MSTQRATLCGKIAELAAKHPTATHVLIGGAEWLQLIKEHQAMGALLDDTEEPVIAGLKVFRTERTTYFAAVTIHHFTPHPTCASSPHST